MNYSIIQLRAFQKVMMNGSVSETARELGRTQSTVSTMIANLESSLHMPLFIRERGRLVPVPEAEYFYEEVSYFLERFENSTRLMQEVSELDRGTLKIACFPAAANIILPQFLSDFVENRPHVKASLITRSSVAVHDLIASQQYDIGIAETLDHRETVKGEIFPTQSICAMHVDSPLAQHDLITPERLSGKPMAILTKTQKTNEYTKRVFEEFGADLNIRFEFVTFFPALEFVGNGQCYMICDPITAHSNSALRGHESKVVFRPFSASVGFSFSIIRPAKRPASALAESFFHQLSKRMHELTNWPA